MIVIDADAHVMESEQTWAYLEPEFYARRPVVVTLPEDTSLGVFNAAWLIDEQIQVFGASPAVGTRSLRKSYSLDSQNLWGTDARLQDMDQRKTDYQVVHPTFALLNLCEDVVLETALMRSYNTFMAEKYKESGGRLLYAAMVPFRSPELAVKEIQRVVAMGGAVAIYVRGLEWDRPLHDRLFYPIYEEAQRHDLAISVHVGSGSPKMRSVFSSQERIRGEEPFWPGGMKRLIGPMTVQFGFYSLAETSLSIDFPKLRWGFLEATGSEWLLGAVGALERAGKGHSRRLFDEGRIFVSVEPSEDFAYMANRFGSDFMVFGSDMPHQDEAAHGNLVEEFSAPAEKLGDEFKQKLFWRNAARLYAFTPKSFVPNPA